MGPGFGAVSRSTSTLTPAFSRFLTRDKKVTYISVSERGRGVQGARRADPTEAARRALPQGRPVAQRARAEAAALPLWGDEAPRCARGGGPGPHSQARARE